MQRYGIYPIIGDGLMPETGFRASIADEPDINVSSIIKTDAQGSPLYDFAFCIIAGGSEAAMSAPTNSFVFPDFPLDSQMSGMESGVRTSMQQSAEAYNLDGAGLHLDLTHAGTDSYRSLLQSVGEQFDAAFNINAFGVLEVAQV